MQKTFEENITEYRNAEKEIAEETTRISGLQGQLVEAENKLQVSRGLVTETQTAKERGNYTSLAAISAAREKHNKAKSACRLQEEILNDIELVMKNSVNELPLLQNKSYTARRGICEHLLSQKTEEIRGLAHEKFLEYLAVSTLLEGMTNGVIRNFPFLDDVTAKSVDVSALSRKGQEVFAQTVK
ncbi:MAG: hypothetical protein NUV74_13310 [Candidatus Brocadiaceae bacterium]|nr:hypothetical protein [Candidatus Brocadiaceae bacterium]